MTTLAPTCPYCHDTGFVIDLVDYGDTTVEMETPCECQDVSDLPFDAIKQADATYPMQAARREQFVASIRVKNDPDAVDADVLETRARQIEAELNDPFISRQEAFALLDELAEIITTQGKE